MFRFHQAERRIFLMYEKHNIKTKKQTKKENTV